mgnify:CR=1 FL=1
MYYIQTISKNTFSLYVMKKKLLDITPKLLTENDLPYSDGLPMESQKHVMQLQLLMDTLKEHYKDQNVYVGGNMFVYFSPDQVKTEDFKGPDFFVALNVTNRLRKSWVVWEEGKGPDLVIELLSKSTKKIDQNEKKWIYQDKLKVSEYFWYDPWTGEWAGFRLTEGAYESIQEDQDNHLISRKLNLALCQWEGLYQDVDSTWLRWCDTEGNLLLLLSEKERHRANIEHLRANQERQRADRLAEQLKNLGVNPDDSL